MKQLLASINLLHIITIIMIGLILGALIAGHFFGNAKGTRSTHTYPATANAQLSR
jgi:hypothetical protein